MHSEESSLSGTTSASQATQIFFFAHQDDEFAVFQAIEQAISTGHEVLCVYCTTGAPPGHSPDQRQRESLHVLKALGVHAQQVLFAGGALGIADQQLMHKLDMLVPWLVQLLKSRPDTEHLYIPAWEGGHPDHDALHAAVLAACRQVKLQAALWQFPLYNGDQRRWGLFRLFKPLPIHGPVMRQSIAARRRWFYLKLCLTYRSQWRSWLGLMPALCWFYLLKGVQQLQRVNIIAALQRPHPGPLYYEQRRFARWTDMQAALLVLQGSTPDAADDPGTSPSKCQ